MSWEHLEDPPHWVTEVYENDGWKLKFEGDYLTAKGDTWVYKIEFGEAYYRQLKSDYYDTTRNESLHASEVDSFDGRTRACSAHVLTTWLESNSLQRSVFPSSSRAVQEFNRLLHAGPGCHANPSRATYRTED